MSERIQQHKPQSADAGHDDVRQRQAAPTLQDNRQAPNRTGMPGQLKAGIEALSGMNMDHVRVHYNSDRPAQLQALAYAQGSDIHLAPGQEQHLPHEAWHVVQQAQGRVRPTMQMQGGVQVNDDAGLEREADVMGGRAVMAGHSPTFTETPSGPQGGAGIAQRAVGIVQRATHISYKQGNLHYWAGGGHWRDYAVGLKTDAMLDPNDPKTGSRTASAPSPSPYTNGNWPTLYQGHLLNANLGGQAIEQNLFPVTPAFNHQHSSIIEDNVKAHFLDLKHKKDNHVFGYANRRLHYCVEVVNPHRAAFKPSNIGDTQFVCTVNYTAMNGNGQDLNLPHEHLAIQVPQPVSSLNEQLSNAGWGADNLPSYQVGLQFPNTNTYQVLDANGHVVPGMTIEI